MSSSSSASSGLSSQSSPSSEPTPEWDPEEAHEAYIRRAIEDGDESSHDFSVWSEDDKSSTDGESDLRFLADGETEEESDDDRFSWDDFTSFEEEEEEDDTSSDEPPASAAAGKPSNDPTTPTEDEDNEGPPRPRQQDDKREPGQQDGPEPVNDDGSPFKFLPPAPVVLFCKNSPPFKKELKDLEEKVRVTKELICAKEASIARSQREAEGLKAELKTDLAEIRALNKQLVTGKDDDDKAEIAEVDHVRAGVLRALETFLQ
ncbi:hypothetical protein QYE76_056633 [Lolium multiflorum]|uniref:Uncharacterized protein n=1 Tax=Lolium multiflorum TaxID=4521 RepID=A0AAD8T327_LOLMU|nr:hypothetical protein QYE76_056633 [Lolium multiflorum]